MDKLSFHFREDRDKPSFLSSYFERYFPVNQSKESMVFAHSYVFAGMEFCSSLTDDNVAGFANLAAEYLDA